MQTTIWAIFNHSIIPSTKVALKGQHKFCHKGKDSWCKFNADLETSKQMYDKGKRLPSSFYNILKPIFSRLAFKDLLEKCLKGITQNANESLNHMVWERCPKATFCSKIRIETAVAEAVCCFNTGACSKALILKAAEIENVGEHSFSALQKEDHLRQVSASQKITRKYKNWRISKKKSKMIFDSSMKHGSFPEAWKRANVVPIHKKNSKNLKINYRPISLFPIFGKIFEKLIFDSLYEHLNVNSLLNPNQSGFRPGDSTIDQLISIYSSHNLCCLRLQPYTRCSFCLS